jgi:hypothetical protein
MPYKDKEKHNAWKRRWRAKNKERCKEIQKKNYKKNKDKYSKNRFISEYCESVKKIQPYDIHQKAIYLSRHRDTVRHRIYEYFIIPFSDQIEKEVKDIRKKRHRKDRDLKTLKNHEYIESWKRNHPCICGESNIYKLSFHHVDSSLKKDNLRRMCQNSLKTVKEELKKCISLCHNCHILTSFGDAEERGVRLIQKYLNSPKQRSAIKKRLLLWLFKKDLFCLKCNIDNPAILLCHHINHGSKKICVSQSWNLSLKEIDTEISKTICLCHNCHEDFHHIYTKRTNQQQLEQYVGKKITPLKVNIQNYLPYIDQSISEFYNLPFLIS